MATHPGVALAQSRSHFSDGRDNNNIYQDSDASLASERRKVLGWLSDMASVDHDAIQSETYHKLAPGTASWILQDPKFDAWLAGKSGTFWGVGMPGGGKTFLSSFVVNHLQECQSTLETDGIVIFSFFRFDDSLTISNILAGLLRQLTDKLTPAFWYIKEKFSRPYEKNIKLSDDELVNAIRTIVNLAPARIFIVLDALDEVRDDIREKLVNILLSLKQSTFITSREIFLANLHAPDIRIHAPAQDLRHFIVHAVKQRPKIWSLLEDRNEVLEELIREIVSKSDGMFLHATLQISALSGITTIQNLRKAARALPIQIKDLYNSTLSRIMAQSDDESSLSRRAILWVTYSCRPLTISELLEVLSVDPDSTELNPDERSNEKILISVCFGLLVVDPKTKIVRLIHYTAHDFFSSYKEGPFEKPHSFIATICIVYLHLSRFCDRKLHAHEDLEGFGKFHLSADYVYRYMGYHTFHASVEGNGEIPRRAYDLLSKNQHIPLFHTNLYTKVLGFEFDSKPIFYGEFIHFSALHGILSILNTMDHSFHKSTSPWEHTALMYAILGGHVPIIRRLIGAGGGSRVNLNAKMVGDRTALHLACAKGDELVVRLLLDHAGVDSYALDCGGRTALHYASSCGCSSVVTVLLNSPGINVNARDHEFGSTALLEACVEGQEQVVRLLLDHSKIDVNIPIHGGRTPLHMATINDNVSIVKLLLESPKIDVNVKAKNFLNDTALHEASRVGHYQTVRMLLDYPKIDINARNYSGETALSKAVTEGHERLVQLLLDHPRINVNAQTEYGITPLHFASQKGRISVVKMLLGHANIDVNARTGETPYYYRSAIGSGLTALDLAEQKGHQEIVTLLREAGAGEGQSREQISDKSHPA